MGITPKPMDRSQAFDAARGIALLGVFIGHFGLVTSMTSPSSHGCWARSACLHRRHLSW